MEEINNFKKLRYIDKSINMSLDDIDSIILHNLERLLEMRSDVCKLIISNYHNEEQSKELENLYYYLNENLKKILLIP
jgi:dihydroxyacetone kinase-like predicted kinase